MDATEAAGGKKAVAACGNADVAIPSSPRAAAPEAVPRQRQLAPLAGDAAAAVDSASAMATTSTVESSGGGEDEQVEKFYALLANIRAMRDMYRSSGAGASADSADGGACGARGMEPAWRPAFRMEDFEEPGMSASGGTTSSTARGSPGSKRRRRRRRRIMATTWKGKAAESSRRRRRRLLRRARVHGTGVRKDV